LRYNSRPGRGKIFAGERFRSGHANGRKREGASTVSFNHPLAAKFKGSRRIMRKLQYLFMALAALCFAIPAFAAGDSTGVISMVPIGAGIGMGLAAGMCGMGQGRAVASATEALARNPGTRAGIMLFLVLGLAFIESLTLFTLVVIFAKIS
jgi:F-type H+-transporting ATPase subunit c